MNCSHRSPLLQRRHIVPALFALVLILFSGPMLRAQATQCSIIGTVHDASGGIVPGATVTLTNIDEGTARTTTSGKDGGYRFVALEAGRYNITVEHSGYARWTANAVALAVRQELHLDAKLDVGAVQQKIVVTGNDVSAIDTQRATISGVLTRSDVLELPVNTRASFSGTSAYSILGELPGVQPDHGQFSVQGALPYQTEVTVDGMTLKNPGSDNVLGDAFPSSESISEIRADGVMTNAEFGDPGQVVVTTRGGTNQLHGSAYMYYQTSAFDAIAYTYPTTQTKPSLQGKTFGGSLGGPVVLPHLYNGHNKTFFFGAYEGWRHPAQEVLLEKVPSTLMKQGNFTRYNSTGFTGLRDPYTGGSFGTQIPSANISPIAKNILSTFYPDPNIGDPASYTDDSNANFQENVDDSGHSDQFDIRGDQYVGSNQKLLVWARYTWKNFPTSNPELLKVPSGVNNSQSRVLRVNANWTLSPNLIDEASFGFTRYTSGASNSFNGTAFTQAQGWQGLQNLYYNGIPEMDFNFIQSLNADRLTSLNKDSTYDYSDSLIWTHQRHTIKFGVDVQHVEAISPLGFNGADNYGTYQFYTSGSSGMFTGVDFADFLLGAPNETFYDVVRQDNDGLSTHYAAYGQDEWRATQRLTLSYGVRYELHPGYSDRYGDIANFNPNYGPQGGIIYPQGKQALLSQSYLASANACDPDGVTNTNSAVVNGAPCMPVLGNKTAGFPAGLKTYPHLRFMPRFGFAWRPTASDRWVVRGGAGMYDINILGSTFYSLTGTAQAQTQQYHNTYNPATHAIGYQWPQVYAGQAGGCSNCYGTDYFGTANSINWKDPYTEQWSLSIDHDFGTGYVARVSYIGSESHQLEWAPNENSLPFSRTRSAYNAPASERLFPNWGRVYNRMTGANASYNSLQVAASHRLQNGFEYNSVFTWAKALADNQGPNNTGFAGETGGGRATSVLDRHADFGNVYGTRRLRWNTTMVYGLPFGRGQRFGSSMSRLTNLIAGGWQLSGILTLQTGPYETPYFPSGQGDPSGTGSGLDSTAAGWDPGHAAQHPDQVPVVSIRPRNRGRLHWINPGAFTCPGYAGWTLGTPCTTGSGSGPVPLPIGRFGNAQVGSVEGPGLFDLSTGLSKTVTITERMDLRAEGTFTNVLNHTNLGDPIMNLSSPNFGEVTSTIGSNSDLGGARTGQVDIRLEF